MSLPVFNFSNMVWKTSDSTDNFAAGTRTFTPKDSSGKVNGNPWNILVDSYVNFEDGTSNQEFCLVTAVTPTTFTCVTTKAHNGTVTPFSIWGFVNLGWQIAWSTGSISVGGRTVTATAVGSGNALIRRGDNALWDDTLKKFVNVDQTTIGTVNIPKM